METSRLVWLWVLLVVLCGVGNAARRKEIDWDTLEKAWEAGDAPSELRSNADDQYDRLNAISPVDAKAMGPQMVFVTLQTKEPLSDMAGRWKEMLWNGGVDVNIYEIEASKVLIGLQKGIFVRELRQFLHQQPEVVTYDWNSKTYSPDDTIPDAPTSKKPKKMKKLKRKLKKTQSASTPHQDHPIHDGL